MISFLLSLLLVVQGSYFSVYSNESKNAMAFYKKNQSLFLKVFKGASENDIDIAFAIVAPEVSQYSAASDFLETKALEMKYVRNGNCDYSVGRFQMKPSFIESLEKEVFKSKALTRKYGEQLSYSKGKNKRAVRRERVERLCDDEWQIRYLAIFVDVVKQRTAGWGLKSSEDKVRYWATMYNAGFYLSKARVKHRQGVKQFPRGTKEFNYSAVAQEFYRKTVRK